MKTNAGHLIAVLGEHRVAVALEAARSVVERATESTVPLFLPFETGTDDLASAPNRAEKTLIVSGPAGDWGLPVDSVFQAAGGGTQLIPFPPAARRAFPMFDAVLRGEFGTALRLDATWHPGQTGRTTAAAPPRTSPAWNTGARASENAGTGRGKLLLVNQADGAPTLKFGIHPGQVRAIALVEAVLVKPDGDRPGLGLVRDEAFLIRDLLRDWTGIPTRLDGETRFVRLQPSPDVEFLFPVDGLIRLAPIPASYTPVPPPSEGVRANAFHGFFHFNDGILALAKL